MFFICFLSIWSNYSLTNIITWVPQCQHFEQNNFLLVSHIFYYFFLYFAQGVCFATCRPITSCLSCVKLVFLWCNTNGPVFLFDSVIFCILHDSCTSWCFLHRMFIKYHCCCFCQLLSCIAFKWLHIIYVPWEMSFSVLT